jgi:type IV/VI secretion system ImpK/VasF family protein
MAATPWLREAVADALSQILLLQRAVATGGFDPHALRRAIEAAVLKIRLDDHARALGFTPELLRRVRLALIATADEITQRDGSLADYSAPPPANETPLLQQKYLGGIIRGGHSFFEELDAAIDARRPTDPESAVLEVFALCIALGFRGKYAARDLAGYEAMRSRVNDKLRRPLALPDTPPPTVAHRWPRPERPTRLLLYVALLCALFSAAMLATYHAALDADIATLRRLLTRHV